MANLQPLRNYIRQNVAHLRSSPYLLISSSSSPAPTITPIQFRALTAFQNLNYRIPKQVKEHQPSSRYTSTLQSTSNDNATTILQHLQPQDSYAIFIDGQNMSHNHCELAQQHIQTSIPSHTLPSIKRLYGDIELLKSDAWSQLSVQQGFSIPHRYPDDANPNLHNTDILMVMDITESLYTNPHIKTYILMTCDGDFAPLVHKLREAGKIVIVYGQQKSVSKALANAAHCYINTTELLAADNQRIMNEKRCIEDAKKNKKEEGKQLAKKLASKKLAAKKQKQKLTEKDKEMILDIIRQKSDSSTKPWLNMGVFGGGLIDYKKHGHKNMLSLFKDLPEIEFKKVEDNEYIRLRQKKESDEDEG